MKLFRFGLNIWITFISILSFLVGWVTLAHSPKPIQPSSQSQAVNMAPLPTLTPLDSPQFSGNNGSQQNFQVSPNSGFSSAPQPIFRTGGS